MTEPTRLEVLARGWRGRLLAALVALIAGLPGLVILPVTDRDEARFAQSTAQMLEGGDFVGINYQDAPLNREPVLAHWLQAASVTLVSKQEARAIWAYRIPSLLAAMLAAAACAWGAEALFGALPGFVAGALLAATMALSTEAGLAAADAVVCGAVTLSMAAFGRIYAAGKGELKAGWPTKLLFWLGLGLAILDKGAVAPVIALLAGAVLALWDRRAPWAKTLGWTWGLLLVAAIVGPWAMAITVRTDGGFWAGSVRDMLPTFMGGRNAHAFPPGYHLLLAAFLLLPATALLPAARAEAWRARGTSGVRFAIAWLAPAWIVFELTPAKLPFDAMPLYGAVAWLCAFALTRPLEAWGRWSGAALSLLAGLGLAIGLLALAARFGTGADIAVAILAGLIAILAGLAGGAALVSRYGVAALVAAGVLAITAHAVAEAAVLSLRPLWTSNEAVAALDRAGLDPRNGLTLGPVAVVGDASPSLVFLLGTATEIGDDVGDAAEAISQGRPAIIEASQDGAFRAELAADKLAAVQVATVDGFDYSRGRPIRLILYRLNGPPPDRPG
jgi:4-amino-4-deoxy-L-arabinose transferase-like glycosyltransferase